MPSHARKPDATAVCEHVPSLPALLLKLIETCNQEEVPLQQVAGIIEKDPSLTGKILKLVNSSLFGLPRSIQTIDQATTLVGLNAVKSMAISASIHQVFGRMNGRGALNLKTFWYHSLSCGILARRLARMTRHCNPDQAFLGGLLHDMGRLVLLNQSPQGKTPRDGSGAAAAPAQDLEDEHAFGESHAEIGACLLEGWNLDTALADCARYHHEPLERIQQALPLVQTVFCANALSRGRIIPCPDDPQVFSSLLGLSETDIESCRFETGAELHQVADSLNIAIEEPPVMEDPPGNGLEQAGEQELDRAVRDLSLLQNSLQGLINATDQNTILRVAGQGLQFLFAVEVVYFFLYDDHKQGLLQHRAPGAEDPADQHELFIMLAPGNRLTSAMTSGQPRDTFTGSGPLSILEEQLIRRSGREGLLCLPMHVQGAPVGLIVLGLSRRRHEQLQKSHLLRMFTTHIGLALHTVLSREAHLQAVQAQRNDASSRLARTVVHEVNSPLTIIKNYLKILDFTLKEQGTGRDEVAIIHDEIDRIAGLVQQLHPDQKGSEGPVTSVEPNTILCELVRLVEDAYLKDRQIRIHLDLTPSRPKVRIHKNSLKQVFLNLMQNAAEAMTSGGNLTIQSRCILPEGMEPPLETAEGGRGYLEITFIDDGPGIPQEMQQSLFDPFQTSKGENHAGLGLSVCFEIIKQCNGRLTCFSKPGEKTRFRIELPLTDS